MTKVIFACNSTRVVDLRTLQPVMEELGKTTGYEIVALINLNQDIRDFPKGRIIYKHISEYKTKNVNRILEIDKPDLVVIAVNSIIEMALMIACKSKSIPTLVVSHGLMALLYRRKLKVVRVKLHRLFFQGIAYQLIFFVCSGLSLYALKIFVRNIVTGYETGLEYATRICASGGKEKAILIGQGVDEEKIIITGQPRFDIIHSDRWKDSRGKVFGDFGFSLKKKLVLIITQPLVEESVCSKEEREALISGIVLGIQKITECVPIIKIHPRENIEDYKVLLKNRGLYAVPVIHMEIPLYDLLSASDLVVGVSSTAMLEALIFGKIVIAVNLFGQQSQAGFSSSGAAMSIEDIEELTSVVRSALYDQNLRARLSDARNDYLYEHAYIQDGQASKRVTDLIIQMIEESRKAKDGNSYSDNHSHI